MEHPEYCKENSTEGAFNKEADENRYRRPQKHSVLQIMATGEVANQWSMPANLSAWFANNEDLRVNA